MNNKKTLAVAAICFPPSLIGPAILMGNLFRHFPKGSYHVLMGRLDYAFPLKDEDSMLPAQYTFTRFPFLHPRGSLRRRIRSFFRDIFALLEVTWKGLKIIRRESIESIFVVAGHYVELSALLMHWLMGKKVVMWLPDLYYVPEVNYARWERILRRFLEPFLLRRINTVLVTAEATQEYYKEKYNLHTEVLPHSVDMTKYTCQTEKTYSKRNTTNILFAGTVEPCNRGPLMDMIEVVTKHPEMNLELNIFSNNLNKEIEEICSKTERVTCGHANRDEIPALQQSADILFLALSFVKHGYDQNNIVRTASPSKLPEYLEAGKPILVYAPPESYYSRYAHQEGFGLVVDKPDTVLLKQAILQLQNDESLCHRLVTNARKVARERHNAVKISNQLQEYLAITGYFEKRFVSKVPGLFRLIFGFFLRRLKRLKKLLMNGYICGKC